MATSRTIERLRAAWDTADMIAELRAENERLRSALEFYAAEENYREVGHHVGEGHYEGRCDAWDDSGEIARQMLAGW